MAYYSSIYYQTDDDLGQYCSAPYEASTQNLFAYDPTPYNYHAFHYTPTLPNISYCASAYNEPLSIEFDPKIYRQSYYDTDVTEFVISYNVSEFNVPEFEEYDPTPYGGGFDLAEVYGKPLSPSEETCYPPSSAPAGVNAAPASNGVKEEIGEQVPKVMPLSGIQEVQIVEKEQGKGNQIEESKENGESYEYEKQGKGNEIEESGENQGSYEYEKQGNQMPSGYGLEAMDICESLFGYWPCLAKDFNRGNGSRAYQGICGEGMYGNPWKGTADYLFGGSNPYGERRDEDSYYGQSVYAYETHYNKQNQNWQG